MKQYRITSENFVLQGETGDTDAVMSPDDLRELKRLAGLPMVAEGESTSSNGAVGGSNGAGTVGGNLNNVPSAAEVGIQSPVGSNISFTAQDRNDLIREFHVMPGSDLWFIIMFTKPYLNGSLRDHVERYLDKHPEYRPRVFKDTPPNF
jgi:hypothetical protein